MSNFTFKKTPSGDYRVTGHPDHPSFTFASVRRVPSHSTWEVLAVFVKDAKCPMQRYDRREQAAQAALDADLAARNTAEERRTCDRNAPLALINSLIMGGVTHVTDIEQINVSDYFQVTYTRENRRTGGDRQDTIIVDRKGDMIGRPGTIVHTVLGARGLRDALERGLGFKVAA